METNSLHNFKHSIEGAKTEFEQSLETAQKIINSDSSNLDVLDIIRKLLDVAPFIILLFPEFKQKLLAVLEPVQKELNELISNLK